MKRQSPAHLRVKTIGSGILCPAICCLAATAMAFAELPAAKNDNVGGANSQVKISTSLEGPHHITYQDLVAKVGAKSLKAANFALFNQGNRLPLRINDSAGDGFGPGDSLVFIAEGIARRDDDMARYNRDNYYILDLAAETASPDIRHRPAVINDRLPRSPHRLATLHFEKDQHLIRFKKDEENHRDDWFWMKISSLAKFTDAVPFYLPNLISGGAGKIRIQMAGWSHLPQDPDHRLHVFCNGKSLGVYEWDGQESITIESEVTWKRQNNRLEFRFVQGEDKKPLDVVLLDWIEIEYPARWVAKDRKLSFTHPSGSWRYQIDNLTFGEVDIFSTRGDLISAATKGSESAVHADSDPVVFDDDNPQPARYFVVPKGQYQSPNKIEGVRSIPPFPAEGADYLIVSHGRFMEAAEKLAQWRRQHDGLETFLVDVEALYDHYQEGFVAPQAIKAFIRQAYQSMRPRQPRYVLLIGDASWDYHGMSARGGTSVDDTFKLSRGDDFDHVPGTPYESQGGPAERLFVPTHSYQSNYGHAASDNWFVCLEGDDFYPDLAIGRLPVATPEEAQTVVNKIIEYDQQEARQQDSNILFITNDDQRFQRRSKKLSDEVEKQGWRPVSILPKKEEKDNEVNTETILENLSTGSAIVHFLGHGGRFIWRTGPPDYRKNHDLFRISDLEKLPSNKQYSVVLSMSCYSAPFDHPSDDSIGEAFLRLADRGAIAVFAASWRNIPTQGFSQRLLDGLVSGGKRIGDIIVAAKQETRSRDLVEQYSLLGDPATKLRSPQRGTAQSTK